jgi:hypothetical protein
MLADPTPRDLQRRSIPFHIQHRSKLPSRTTQSPMHAKGTSRHFISLLRRKEGDSTCAEYVDLSPELGSTGEYLLVCLSGLALLEIRNGTDRQKHPSRRLEAGKIYIECHAGF